MIKKFKNLLIIAASVFALSAPALVPAVASAQSIQSNLCSGASASLSGGTDCSGGQATSKLNGIIKLVINLFSIIVGIVSVIMIIIGGLKYITSGGEASNISGAKNTIIYAIVGLVIVALAQFIVHFVLGKVSQGA
jgi:hypothetical protein